MQAFHARLRQYQEWIGPTQVKSIQIDANELRVITQEGVAMVWDPEDLRTAPNVLINHGSYEPEESSLLLESARDCAIVFDIGANVGFYSLHWSRRLAKHGAVHAFEPVPRTYSRLARNVALNGLSDVVTVNNLGLSDQTRGDRMFLPNFSGSGAASIINLHPEESSEEVDVRLTTLDKYVSDNQIICLDLMKIDVEGAELMVLRGGMETISQHRPLIFTELLRKWSRAFGYHPNDVIQLLGTMGYGCWAVKHGRLKPFEAMNEQTVETNFFFAHREKHRDWISRHLDKSR